VLLLKQEHGFRCDHPVDTAGALVGLHSYQCLLQIVTLDNHFHGRPGRPAFDIGFRRTGFGLLSSGASGFMRRATSLPNMSFGVAFGAKSPYQLEKERAGIPLSRNVGISGATASLVSLVTA
jgi:hypothetical protein